SRAAGVYQRSDPIQAEGPASSKAPPAIGRQLERWTSTRARLSVATANRSALPSEQKVQATSQIPLVMPSACLARRICRASPGLAKSEAWGGGRYFHSLII